MKGNIELKLKKAADKQVLKNIKNPPKVVLKDIARFRKDLDDEEEYDEEEAKVQNEIEKELNDKKKRLEELKAERDSITELYNSK